MNKITGRTFFVVYDSGHTLYFNIVGKDKIRCKDFSKMVKRILNRELPDGHSVEITENDVILRNEKNESIFSLSEYNILVGNSPVYYKEKITGSINSFYIDDDVQQVLNTQNKLFLSPNFELDGPKVKIKTKNK